MGTQIDNFKLIKFVKENPALYDPRHEHYTHAVVKQMLWDKIAKDLNKSCGNNVKDVWKYKPSYITTRWASLKYTYIRRMQSKATGKAMKMWRYERELEFLYPFLKDKIGNGNDCTSDDSTEFEYTSGSDSIDEFDDDDDIIDNDDEEFSNGGVKQIRKKIDERKLIELIKKNPVLYDANGYKSVITCAWKQIADEMKIPVRNVKQCWRRLRKRYAKVLMYYRAHKDEAVETKRPRWKYQYEMDFVKSFIEAKLEKRDELIKKQTLDFFMSMAEKVKTFPLAEQEAMEILILDMITEAELEYHTELQKKKSTITKLSNNNSNQPNEGTSNGVNSCSAMDENEFISRVKWADNDNDKKVTTSSAIPIIDEMMKNVQPTERYVVKVIPEAASTELQEEFVINVLPDSKAAEIHNKSNEIAETKIKEEKDVEEMVNDIKVEKDIVVKEETMMGTVVKMEPYEVNS